MHSNVSCLTQNWIIIDRLLWTFVFVLQRCMCYAQPFERMVSHSPRSAHGRNCTKSRFLPVAILLNCVVTSIKVLKYNETEPSFAPRNGRGAGENNNWWPANGAPVKPRRGAHIDPESHLLDLRTFILSFAVVVDIIQTRSHDNNFGAVPVLRVRNTWRVSGAQSPTLRGWNFRS